MSAVHTDPDLAAELFILEPIAVPLAEITAGPDGDAPDPREPSSS